MAITDQMAGLGTTTRDEVYVLDTDKYNKHNNTEHLYLIKYNTANCINTYGIDL